MILTASADFLNIFNEVAIGVVHGVIHASLPQLDGRTNEFRAAALKSLRARVGQDEEALGSLNNITVWREAYRKFGVKPKKHRPTHEALARRLVKTGTWPEINPIVDIYLTNQIEHLLPHGGYDMAALTGDLLLTVSPGGEIFEPLGGGQEFTDPGEVVYRDAERILTRRWNYKDCDVTKITNDTKSFILMLEAPEGIAPDLMEKASSDLAHRYSLCFDGKFDSFVIKIGHAANQIQIT